MRTDKNLSARAKEIIKSKMDESNGTITIEQAKEEVRPHFEYDIEDLIDKALTRKTRSLIYSFRDKKGVRSCYADGNGKYINVETTNDRIALRDIEAQLNYKMTGLLLSLRKVHKRQKELPGQLNLFDDTEIAN